MSIMFLTTIRNRYKLYLFFTSVAVLIILVNFPLTAKHKSIHLIKSDLNSERKGKR